MELLIGLLERRKEEPDIPVPVLVSAAAYNTHHLWEEWLASHLAQRFSMPGETVARLLRDRRILPVVDGLDEMDVAASSIESPHASPSLTAAANRSTTPNRPKTAEPDRARALVAALNGFMTGRERAAVVATCRQEEYQELGLAVDKATHIEMLRLNGRESASYLSSQLRGDKEKQAWKPVLADLRVSPGGLLVS